MVKLRHPNLGDTEIEVTEEVARVWAKSGWKPVRSTKRESTQAEPAEESGKEQ